MFVAKQLWSELGIPGAWSPHVRYLDGLEGGRLSSHEETQALRIEGTVHQSSPRVKLISRASAVAWLMKSNLTAVANQLQIPGQALAAFHAVASASRRDRRAAANIATPAAPAYPMPALQRASGGIEKYGWPDNS